MIGFMLAMALATNGPEAVEISKDTIGLLPGDVMMVFNRGEIVEQMDQCRGDVIGAMRMTRKGQAFEVCLAFSKDPAHRWWVEFPRNGQP